MYAPSGVIRSVGMIVVKFMSANEKDPPAGRSSRAERRIPASGQASAPRAAPGPGQHSGRKGHLSLSLAQLQPKAGPAALAVLGADRAAVLLRDSAHDGEPQP